MQLLKFKKIKQFFAHKRLKKPPQKVAYLWKLEVFFLSATPPAQNSPEVHFHFIHSSVLKSVHRAAQTKLRSYLNELEIKL